MTYGTGTHSHLRSTEYRQMKEERAEATKQFEADDNRSKVRMPVACTCREYPWPHLHRGEKFYQ